MAGIHRTRPGAADIAPAVEGAATSIGDRLWMSPGVSYSYAIGTDDGRVVINAGLPFEGPIRRRAFDAVEPGLTRALILTQSHGDHFGGFRGLVDDGTDIVMQANHGTWRDDHNRLPMFRPRNTAFAFAHLIEAMVAGMSTLPPEELTLTVPEPTVVIDKRYELTVGGREIVLFWTPGGETTDAMIVWLPDDRTVFTGNLFGPLFGHVPNLVTMRGDRYRDALQYIEGADLVLSLGAERLVTGHFEPIEGADLITEEVTALRDSMQWVHDHTVEAMEAGTDVKSLMREIRLPHQFDIGEGYGKTTWNARAIWETYTGWFHHTSTTELYGVPFSNVAGDLVTAAGSDPILAAARTRLDAGEPLEAIHLAEVVLAADPSHVGAHKVTADANEQLLGSATNFWEKAWLGRAVDQHRAGETR